MLKRKKKRQELEEVSRMLESLLNGKDIPDEMVLYEDTLFAKVCYQIQKVSETNRGITERIEKERNEMKELIGEIAHQMRNPLASIESYTQLLSSEVNGEKGQQHLAALQQAEQSLHFLTESFIRMSRLEHRMIQIQKNSNRMETTVLSAVLLIQKAAVEKHMTVTVSGAEQVAVWHDENWMREAIYNLLDNSVKYAPAGSEIQIRLSQDEMYARIQVVDEGIGICEGEENRIFQRFYRGSQTAGISGFGLGLYISREIVLLHGGFMKARRKENGLEVAILIPANDENDFR